MTISEIAKRAGVGKATVSRVINKSGSVKEETRQRVEAVIAECGYTPSTTARNLSRQKSDTVALVIPEFSNSFFGDIISGITSIIDQNGLNLILFNTENTASKDIKALEEIRKQRVSGVLYTPAEGYDDNASGEIVKTLLSQLDVPVVLIDRRIANCCLDGVYSDNFQGAYMATIALIEAGHRDIGIVAGDCRFHHGRRRMDGFRQALQDHLLPYREEFTIDGQFHTKTTYQQTKAFLSGQKKMPTAYFVSNNLSGVGFLKCLNEAGYRVPNDLAYICFDPIEGLDMFGISLSCLDRDVKQMGVFAMQLLLEREKSPDMRQQERTMVPTLTLCGSEKRFDGQGRLR